MAVELEWDEKGIAPRDQASLQALLKGSFGLMKSKRLELEPEEVLYLMDVRKASCGARVRHGRRQESVGQRRQ